jgi:DNA-binding SARP family transcriptional activator
MLTLQLLGTPQVLHNGQALPLTRRKSRALLYYVAATPQPVARRHLAALLWHDHPDQTARHNLRTTLYHLRQVVGDYLHADDEWVSLDATAGALEIDTRRLTQRLAPAVPHAAQPDMAQLADALTDYRGDFLSGFDLPDSLDYEDWLTVTREHYRRLAIGGFHSLSRQQMDAGHYAEALAALARALAMDPFQEDLQRIGLRLHYYAGDRAGAIRRYDEFVRLLDAEMGVPPMAETRDLYTAILTDALPMPIRAPQEVASAPLATPPPIPPAAAPPVRPNRRPPAPTGGTLPFMGRTEDLRRLAELHHTHQLILVEGEAGMGKTRLVETYIEAQLDQAEPPVALWGRGRELESRLPYQPIIEALRLLVELPEWPTLRARLQLPALWWHEAARLLPELAPAGAPAVGERSPDESRVWEGIYQLLAALAQQQPVIFFIDDLHWADAATLGLLGYLVRQSAEARLPITYLAATRPTLPRAEAGILAQALVREDRLVHLRLERLETAAVMALARTLSPTYGYPLGNWLDRSAEGIPLVVAELLRYARSTGILLPDGTVNLGLLPTAPVVPPTVYTLIQARLATLSEGAQRVLDAAVAIGREFEFEIVARVAALSDNAALDALDELRQARLIHLNPHHRFVFDHSLTMEVAYQEVGELRHRLLHRRVAASLESLHSERLEEMAGLIAEHYAEGDQPEQAAKYARLAAERAMRLAAWKSAIAFYRQALVSAPAADRPLLLVALGGALVRSGEPAAGDATLREALRLPETLRQTDLLVDALQGLAEALILQGHYGAVAELAQRFIDDPRPPVRIVAYFSWGAALSLEGLDLTAAAHRLGQAQAEFADARLPHALEAQIEFELGNIDAQQGRLDGAVAHYTRALALARTVANDDGLRAMILAYNNLAYHLHLQDDPRALGYAQTGLTLARERGLLTLLPYLASTLGELALAQGDTASAEASFSLGLAHAQRLAHPERIAGLTANLGLVAQARGQTDLAVHRLSSALAQADAIPSRFLGAQIRLWLAPLVPSVAAQALLTEARTAIHTANYTRLLPQLESCEAALAARETTPDKVQ